MKYIYPKLPAVKTFPFIRLGGYGLANCLFVYAKAIVLAERYQASILTPTWINFSIGPYLRNQIDKRHYYGLFVANEEISGFKRLYHLLNTTSNENEFCATDKTLVVEGIYDFFKPLLFHHNLINKYLLNHINPKLLAPIRDFDFSNCIATHVRLGDFTQERRIPLTWYKQKILDCFINDPVLIFSDGKDEELVSLLELPNVKRISFGNAIADLIAMSRCKYIIGSDSSYSAWGAFLGQVPCSFYRLEFGQILENEKLQDIVESNL